MKNYLSEIIGKLEKQYLCSFKPNKLFYQHTGIKQKLFGQIMRNEKQPDFLQAEKLCNLFAVPIEKLVDLPKQLEMFEPEFVVVPFDTIKKIELFVADKLGNKQKEEFTPILETLKPQ
ncbi:MAG: hypothetical protein JXR68_14275 [Bacteroidales bacterium]|nr:hypothetical protein [Bacteroidales bacterium]